jgi:hypothetical protein
MGRLSKYTEALGLKICERLSSGESLNAICKDEDMPAESTVRSWAIDPDHPITAKYARAREVGYLKMADELLEIADDGTNDYTERANDDGEPYKVVDHDHIARSRLRVETRKWLLSKALPKVYGDKTTTEVVGKDGAPLVPVLNVIISSADTEASS